jgi:hypothetical protein
VLGFGLPATLTAGTLITAQLLGVGGGALASLFTVRRLLHLDLPATLRVVK